MGPCHADGLPADAAIANFDPHASTAHGRQVPNHKSHQSGCKQTGRTDGDLAAASRARAWPAERTLCFPQTERLVPRRTQIRLPLCNVRGGEQHGGSSEPPCTSGRCSERPSGSREIWPQMNKWHDIDGRSRAFCCILLYI